MGSTAGAACSSSEAGWLEQLILFPRKDFSDIDDVPLPELELFPAWCSRVNIHLNGFVPCSISGGSGKVSHVVNGISYQMRGCVMETSPPHST